MSIKFLEIWESESSIETFTPNRPQIFEPYNLNELNGVHATLQITLLLGIWISTNSFSL